jgi:hypothetical protein
MFNKSPREKAAAEANRIESQKRREAEKFAKSPPGRAQAAKEKGARIFQISIPLSKTTANVVPMIGAFTQGREVETHTTVLDSIEAQGWRLEHAGYVFRVTGSESRDKFMSSGQQEAVAGEIMGIYLFRAVEA